MQPFSVNETQAVIQFVLQSFSLNIFGTRAVHFPPAQHFRALIQLIWPRKGLECKMAEMLGHMAFDIAGVLSAEWTSRYGGAEGTGTAFRDERKLFLSKLSRMSIFHMIQESFARLKNLRRMISDHTSPAHAVF